ncbi:methyl-accepting chemotaxis protein [Asticcacaulis excentricus]|uniref:Methyl-accepting chemotaxis protein n=1 Tax=Asticcacaulis excentricus TaxID=78587 RepID=A0A3G9G671_9CAUL|nr:methyl-accepting chemotaxis protein [Asticcacaulis excentricus]
MSSAITLSDILSQTRRAKTITHTKVQDIRAVTAKLRILALNALIEAKHAGDKGAGFSVVADEVRAISTEVEGLARDLGNEIINLDSLTQDMALASQGARLTDMALNAIELIDRNLYERTCDVRWWATDSALWQAATDPTPAHTAYASRRLGVILGSRLIDQSQKMTVAAISMAEKKVWAQRSYRVCTRRQSLSLANMFSTLWRCL